MTATFPCTAPSAKTIVVRDPYRKNDETAYASAWVSINAIDIGKPSKVYRRYTNNGTVRVYFAAQSNGITLAVDNAVLIG